MRKNLQESSTSDLLKFERDQEEIRANLQSLRNELGRVVKSSGAQTEELLNHINSLTKSLKGTSQIEKEEFLVVIEDIGGRITRLEDNCQLKDEFKRKVSDLKKEISSKVDIDEVQASLNASQADVAGKILDLRHELLDTLRLANTTFTEQLEQKASVSSLKKGLAVKANCEDVERLVDNYLRSIEMENVSERLHDLELQAERMIEGGEFDNILKIVRDELDDLKSMLMQKANLEDICGILDKKSGNS